MDVFSGSLHLILGPMFSGKSSSLISQLTRYADVGFNILYINHADDDRDSDVQTVFSTHSSHFKGKSFSSPNIKAIKANHLQSVDVGTYHVIGVDECQFFDDLDVVVKRWVNQENKIVFCAGLDGDARMEVFGKTLNLIPVCDSIEKLHAKCTLCLENWKSGKSEPQRANVAYTHNYITGISNAPFTGKFGGSSSQKEVGGLDLYRPLCRYHFIYH
jgi:thymidine kinase